MEMEVTVKEAPSAIISSRPDGNVGNRGGSTLVQIAFPQPPLRDAQGKAQHLQQHGNTNSEDSTA
jgi:hypothetical protein